MNINDYRYIVTIADTGSFTSAANKLFISQPSLSQRVKHIESVYEISIFTRDSKGVSLTPEGTCFVRYAKQILTCDDNMRKELLDIYDPGKTPLRVGIAQFINTPFFSKMLNRVNKNNPQLKFQLVEGSSLQLQQSLLLDDIDIAICCLPIISTDLIHELIYDDRFVLLPAKGSDLEKKIQRLQSTTKGRITHLDPKLLDNESFVVGMPGTRSYQFVTSVTESHKININIMHFCKNMSTLHKIASAGTASVFLNQSFFDYDLEPKPYYYLKDTSSSSLPVAVVWRKDVYLCEAAKKLIETTQEMQDQDTAN